MTSVQFINAEEWKVAPEAFEPFVDRLHTMIDCLEGTLNVVLVNDSYIRSLNKAYRGKDQPTDVLSFNYIEESGLQAGDLAGEVYISIETAQRQAKDHHWSLQEELERLFVHGFLHVHGYDHEDLEDYKVMHALECQALEKELPFVE